MWEAFKATTELPSSEAESTFRSLKDLGCCMDFFASFFEINWNMKLENGRCFDLHHSPKTYVAVFPKFCLANERYIFYIQHNWMGTEMFRQIGENSNYLLYF